MKKVKKAAGRKKPHPEIKILETIHQLIDANQRCLFILKGMADKLVLPANSIQVQCLIKVRDASGRDIIIPLGQIEAVVAVPAQGPADNFRKIRDDLARRLLNDTNFFVVINDGRRLECTPEFLAFFYRESGAVVVGLREKNGESHEIPIQDILSVEPQST